jgi:hypothetical protein
MVTNFSNALFAPIVDADGVVQGVIQLINLEKESSLFDKAYMEEFENVCKIIGTAIRN